MVAFSQGYLKNPLRFNKIIQLQTSYGFWLKDLPDDLLDCEFESAIWQHYEKTKVSKRTNKKQTKGKTRQVVRGRSKKKGQLHLRKVSKGVSKRRQKSK